MFLFFPVSDIRVSRLSLSEGGILHPPVVLPPWLETFGLRQLGGEGDG